MNCIATRTRSQMSGWSKILPPAVDCSRRKHAGVPHCSSSSKWKRAKEVILLSEEEEGSDHVGKFKTRKKGLNVCKGNTEEEDNDDEMRKFSREKGCSSSWKDKEQSEASSRGSQWLLKRKMKCRKPGIVIFSSISGKGEKKGAIELMSSGDDNEDSTEVEEFAKRPPIQARKIKKLASMDSSRVHRRREKASNKLNLVKKKWNFQRSEDDDEESISKSDDDVDDTVTYNDYVDDDEEDVNLKERTTSPLRSYQDGMDSKVIKAGSLHCFQKKGKEVFVDLVSSEDDDNTMQLQKKEQKTDSLGSETGTRKAKENIPEKARSAETKEESVGGRKNARLSDGKNEGVSRNRFFMEQANKKISLGKEVEEEGTQSLSFVSEEEEEEEDTDDDDDDDDYNVDNDCYDDSEEDDLEECEEEIQVENQVEQSRSLNKREVVMGEEKIILKNGNNILRGRSRHDSCKKQGREYNSIINRTRSHMEKIPNGRCRTSYSEDGHNEEGIRKEDRDTFTNLEASHLDGSTDIDDADDGYDDNDDVGDVKGVTVNANKGIKEEVKKIPGDQKHKHKTELNIDKRGKKTSGQHIHDNEDDLDTNDYGNTTDGNCFGGKTITGERYKEKKNSPVELTLFDLLMDTINEKMDTSPEEVKACEEKIPTKMKLPLRWSSSESESEKSDSEGGLEDLWNELNFTLRLNEIGCPDWHETKGELSTNITQSPGTCQHQFLLDEQIGIVCEVCNFVKVEIKYTMPPMIKRMYGKSGKSFLREEEGISEVDEFECQEFSTDGHYSRTFSGGTAWDLIPDLKEKMFQHQKEGFEFIWKNLGGGIAIKDFKSTGSDDIGGCLISHAPGTGKTLLTIAFLRSFLLLFDHYRPMIVAPLILLSTWENEFRKWGIGAPFHILNRNEFSGKENGSVLEIFWRHQSKLGHGRKQNLRRMVKIFSWIRDKSILGISYNLFGKLTAEKQRHREGDSIRSLLLEYPGLLVLDEGHIARNKQSKLWQCLKQVRTQRRIMLSGTPFQNNFDQLFSILYLIRPNFAKGIFERFKDHESCLDVDQADEEYLLHEKNERVLRRSFATFSEGIEPEETSSQLKELRSIIDPFIHIHERTIHELPGLRDYFVYLYPSALQRCLLDKLTDRTNFDYDHKVSCICVHPSLLLRRSSQKDNKKDQAIIQEHMSELKKEQLHDGVKVRFVIELVQLCEAINEKILVFSQFIDPLFTVKRHLISFFGWTDGREVLQLDGSIIDQKQRQSLIHTFNDMSKEVKVLLVSTKVCAEGIDLTGASRVVLLDLVWNPSVRKQAISRAYRIGQRKVVYAYNLIASSTLEEKKYNIQDIKDKFGQLVFSAPSKNSTGARLVDMMANYDDKVLFELVKRDKNASLFQRVIELKYGQRQ